MGKRFVLGIATVLVAVALFVVGTAPGQDRKDCEDCKCAATVTAKDCKCEDCKCDQTAVAVKVPAPDDTEDEGKAGEAKTGFRRWNRSKERAFIKTFCQILDSDKCDLDKRTKRQIKFALVFSPKARQEAKDYFQDAYEVADEEIRLGATGSRGPPVDFENIDWENFDFQAAADFWVAVIKAIGELIKAFI